MNNSNNSRGSHLHYQPDDKDRRIKELEAAVVKQRKQMNTAIELLSLTKELL